ncbi:MAG: hypothetical protein ABW252_11195 [Polyangiales bacterium]
MTARPYFFFLALLALLTVGCASRTPTGTANAATRAVPTIAEVDASCVALTRRGIACSTDYEGGAASMIVHFETEGAVDRDEPVITRNVGLPFCEATRARGVAAKYVVELHGYGQRHLDCVQATWSEWIRPASLTMLDHKTIAQACEALAAQSGVPVKCVISGGDGMTKLSLVARSAHMYSFYADELKKRLLMPFCKALNASGAGGVAQEVVATEKQFRTTMCETWHTSAWMSYDAQPTEAARQPAPREQSAAPNRSL